MIPAARVPCLPSRRLAALVVAAGLGTVAGTGELRAQQLRTLSDSRRVTNEHRIEVNVRYGIGRLNVRRGPSGLLHRTRMRFDERFAIPTTEYDDGRLEVAMEIVDETDEDLADIPSIDLELAPDIPMDLELLFIGGEAEVDLTGMPVERLSLNIGASDTELRISSVNSQRIDSARINVGVADFEAHGLGNLNAGHVSVKAGLGLVTLGLEGEWPEDARLSINMGLGGLRIFVPESLGVRVRHEGSFLASIDADGFAKRGDTYTSHNWDRAGRRVEVDLSATLGSVEFVWIS